jgi:soluble lytic murein transglycosylase
MAALAAPHEDDPDAIRQVRAAISFERAGDTAKALAGYAVGIKDLSPIADWLRLRAAALTRDSSDRQAFYRAIHTQPALNQVGPAEARALERLGNSAAAIAARARLGQRSEVFRLRLASAITPAARRAVLDDLVRYAADSGQSPFASGVAGAALSSLSQLSSKDLLVLARASSPVSASDQAVAYYRQAVKRGAALTVNDHFRYGEALFTGGSYTTAATEFARVTSGPRVASALLLRGRALVRANRSGRAVLEQLVQRFPRDSVSTPAAMAILGELARDAGQYETARKHWKALGVRFPRSEPAPRARMMAAIVSYSLGRFAEAGRELDSLFYSGDGAEELEAAGYWAGRAWAQAGQNGRAQERWSAVAKGSPLSYYSSLSAKRSGVIALTGITPGTDSFPRVDEVDEARDRLSLLIQTGLTPELGLETRWLASQAGDQSRRLLATANLLRNLHRGSSTTQLGWRVLSQGDTTNRTFRLIFPLIYGPELKQAANANGVEPSLVAALIRQESLFDSMATSRAGARGLMQVMPSVGRMLAREARLTHWTADSLYSPGINLDLGSRHLASAISRYGGLERTLAAYNAGGSRVTRWATFPGADDPELFVEWIPFRETRTYVRTVLRNREFYRALYRW